MSEKLTQRRLKPGVKWSAKRQPGEVERKRYEGPATVMMTAAQQESFADLLEPITAPITQESQAVAVESAPEPVQAPAPIIEAVEPVAEAPTNAVEQAAAEANEGAEPEEEPEAGEEPEDTDASEGQDKPAGVVTHESLVGG